MANITHSTKPTSIKETEHKWHLIDVEGKVLGRVANEIAHLLQGKHKINYAPYLDMGDAVVVINAEKVVVTGSKEETKTYGRFSGYPGGLKTIPYKTLQKTNPAEIIKHAVSGMLPKNKLRDRRLTRLYIYKADKHPYAHKFTAVNSEDKSESK